MRCWMLCVRTMRAVIAAGWGGLTQGNLPDTVFAVDAVSRDWLQPKMAAATHHGGRGTTGAALRAGIPQIVAPFVGDQFFWAQQIEKRGLGPRGIPHTKLTAGTLRKAIGIALNDQTIRKRAADIG